MRLYIIFVREFQILTTYDPKSEILQPSMNDVIVLCSYQLMQRSLWLIYFCLQNIQLMRVCTNSDLWNVRNHIKFVFITLLYTANGETWQI